MQIKALSLGRLQTASGTSQTPQAQLLQLLPSGQRWLLWLLGIWSAVVVVLLNNSGWGSWGDDRFGLWNSTFSFSLTILFSSDLIIGDRLLVRYRGVAIFIGFLIVVWVVGWYLRLHFLIIRIHHLILARGIIGGVVAHRLLWILHIWSAWIHGHCWVVRNTLWIIVMLWRIPRRETLWKSLRSHMPLLSIGIIVRILWSHGGDCDRITRLFWLRSGNCRRFGVFFTLSFLKALFKIRTVTLRFRFHWASTILFPRFYLGQVLLALFWSELEVFDVEIFELLNDCLWEAGIHIKFEAFFNGWFDLEQALIRE